MCGIAGIWSHSANNLNGFCLVEAMIESLTHRGPDSFGLWQCETESLVLGHRRLAIQDISPLGHQPMHSSSKRFSIVFNGEIYNFKELQSDLEALGSQFRGGSDTEVLLEAIEKWGFDVAVERLEGMFAFALYDSQLNELFLVRDRLGEKPLYFFADQSQLIFASELKAITLNEELQLSCDFEELNSFFRYGYYSIDKSPFLQIKKLEAGHYLKISINSAQSARFFEYETRQYWAIKTPQKATKKSDSQVVREFQHLMESTVKKQSIADVELGVFLSGGIDSSLVAATLQNVSANPIKTFTVAFDDPKYNEARFAAEIANHLGTEHTEISLSMEECFEVIELLPQLLDEPFADPSLLPTYLVTKEAKKHVTVCLSGDGGDELFAGYNRYISANKLNKLKSILPRPVRNSLGFCLDKLPLNFWDAAYVPFAALSRLLGNVPEKDIGLKAHKLALLLKASNNLELYVSLLSFWKESPLKNSSGLSFGYYQDIDSLFSNAEENFYEFAMLNDQKFYLASDNLFKVDRAAMFNSLEVRLPLLSHHLVEFANELPIEYKVREGKSKWIMRELLYQSVPKSLIERPKMGFSVPLNKWFKGELKSWAEEYIGNRELLEEASLNVDVVNEAWHQHQKGQRDNANALWTVITYLIWFKKNLSIFKR